MSENQLDREPIQLVELVLPRCINAYGNAPCTAAGGAGQECYNTRATCQDPDNYRDTPDRHLTPDVLAANGATIPDTDLTRTASLFATFEVLFASAPDGVIWEQGSSTTGALLGVTSDELVFRAGDGGTPPAANIGRIAIDVTPYIGKSMTVCVEIDFTASSTSTVRMWLFDPVELSLTLVGEDDFTAGTEWADTDDGAIGTIVGTSPSGETTADWNGRISEARFYDNQNAPADMSDNFRQSLWLGMGVKGEPIDEVKILPCLLDVSTMGTRININAADDNYQPLGRRSTLDFEVADFTYSDIGQDPYLNNRKFVPSQLSTFWRKWLARQKFGKVGARVVVHEGYADQPLSEYLTRSYVLDRVDRGENGLRFYCRDELSRTEFRKAKVPEVSTGVLAYDVLSTDLSFIVVGDVREEYPTSGTVRMDDETIKFSGLSYSAMDDETTFTVTERGSDGSEAIDHDANDLVQICRRYTADTIDTVITEWLVDDSAIPGQLIDISRIEDEVLQHLSAYSLTTLLTEPTAVDTLLGKLSEECSFFLFWDERSQKITMRAIHGVTGSDITKNFSASENIIKGSFQLAEKPKQRLNVVNFYYNPINFADDLDKAANFRSGLKVVNGNTSLPEQYGNLIQSREIFSLFLTTEAEANQTAARLVVRYGDVPAFCEFTADAKDRSTWTGDIITVTHPMVANAMGVEETRRWLVVEAEEVDPGHLIRLVCADITLDGLIYVITENGIGSYDPELFALGNAFITDNNGLNSDGTEGAKIT